MKPIIIIPSGTLNKGEISDLKLGGYIVIVSDNPEKVKIIDNANSAGLTKDKLLNALMRVVYNSTSHQADYIREWLCRILLSELGAVKDK